MRQRLCPRPRTAVLLAALGLAPALATAPSATAQVAAGGGGRALDANQRAGSGRTNTLENQVDYRVRNELLTGNVGGVLGFQDDHPVGRPPGEHALGPRRRDHRGQRGLQQLCRTRSKRV